ncbi:ribonuclease H1-like isoform X2 [Odontomachus brunneus]|uniref:ribonuclease H1-like isoform X2 n=1 Tax=Odontomachus brunneus TaxID=486640 RepID=UPI0013F1C43B|nr:ribonuclease H1-like isoform X2 [Odontomachus brunneus]
MKLKFIFALLGRYFSNQMPYYAVAKGRKPGIYTTWDECNFQVNKFPGSIYKKFATENEAQNFIKERSSLNIRLNYTETGTAQSTKLHTLPKQLSLLGKRQAAVTKTDVLLPLLSSKRTLSSTGLSTNNDVNDEFPIYLNKRRKISNSESNLFTKQNNTGKIDFIIDEDGYVNVFTDGACSSNGYKNARAGIGVWFQDHHPLNISQPVEGRPTNNMAEIQAVTVAARQAKKAGIKKLRINTDSKFIISCITNWMPKWKRTGWKTIGNKPVINKTELLEMEKELESLTVTWNHVNGHVGIYGNEMADKLAREGCLQYKKSE